MKNFIKQLWWYYLFVLVLLSWMAYANLTGWRIFTFNSQQTWNAGGPGYHK